MCELLPALHELKMERIDLNYILCYSTDVEYRETYSKLIWHEQIWEKLTSNYFSDQLDFNFSRTAWNQTDMSPALFNTLLHISWSLEIWWRPLLRQQESQINFFLHPLNFSGNRSTLSQTLLSRKFSSSFFPQTFTISVTSIFSSSLLLFCFSIGSCSKGAGGVKFNGPSLVLHVETFYTPAASLCFNAGSLTWRIFCVGLMPAILLKREDL